MIACSLCNQGIKDLTGAISYPDAEEELICGVCIERLYQEK